MSYGPLSPYWGSLQQQEEKKIHDLEQQNGVLQNMIRNMRREGREMEETILRQQRTIEELQCAIDLANSPPDTTRVRLSSLLRWLPGCR